MDKLNDVIFYTVEKAIKSYRRYAQKRLKENGLKITIDQWLIINNIMENPTISQQEIAERAFKDNASVTRIIELLFKAKYLKRSVNKTDRRKTHLLVTDEGKDLVNNVLKVALEYRATALKGISKQDIDTTNRVLSTIIANCN
ncbi:MAG: MarR family transcriptional regulator [Bacteroidota bacterium]